MLWQITSLPTNKLTNFKETLVAGCGKARAPKTGASGGWGAVVNPMNWRELDLAIYGYLYTYRGIGFEVVDGGLAQISHLFHGFGVLSRHAGID